uniref:Replication protein A 70 kDa DNA-binding subunit B n=1 Tax=Tanacetum cinerariifolium TaxID=118510 RepID=A0A6L2P2Q9_TANCI|nr:replication protein A 70 kDa DNA-binding subunit B [Tanacetum cinerariifolium]
MVVTMRTVILEDFEGARLECCFFYSWFDKFTKLYDKRDKSGIVVMILQLAKTYLECNQCGRSAKEVDDDQSSSSGKRAKNQKLWYCKVHKALTASGVGMRFKVIVPVIDDTRQHGENYDDYFLDELNVLVGKRLLFRFHYTDDHINNNNHVYQVKMSSQDEAMITMFKKDFIIEEPEVDMQTPVPSNANSSRFTNVDSIPFKLDETPKSSYVATQGNASHEDGDHNSMEIKSDAGGSGSRK